MNLEEHAFFFLLFGIIGIFLEIFFTSIRNFIKKKDKSLKGISSLWMFFIYGFIYFIILFGVTYISEYNIIFRGLIYMLSFYVLEFCSGGILKRFNIIPWDYSPYTKFNFKGIIRLDFAPLWFIGGLMFETIYLYLKAHLIF